jgi:hypothetical protein
MAGEGCLFGAVWWHIDDFRGLLGDYYPRTGRLRELNHGRVVGFLAILSGPVTEIVAI